MFTIDKKTQSDLVIVAAGLAGIAVAQLYKAYRRPDHRIVTADTMVLPVLVAAADFTRRGARMADAYPQQTAIMGLVAFGLGAGLSMASQSVRAFLPKVG
jgi:hypothetical protein